MLESKYGLSGTLPQQCVRYVGNVVRGAIFSLLQDGFAKFLQKEGGSDKSEYLIPNAVGGWITQGSAKVKVLATSAKWAGMTYPEDKQLVAAYLRGLVSQGVYPDPLF
jgi:hypothetical protein